MLHRCHGYIKYIPISWRSCAEGRSHARIMQIYTLTNDMKITCSHCINIHTDSRSHACINKTYMNVLSVTDPRILCISQCVHAYACVCEYGVATHLHVCVSPSLYVRVSCCRRMQVGVCMCPGTYVCVFFPPPVQSSNSMSSGLSDIDG